MESDRKQPTVWLITDQKPGHRNQLRGLGNRLKALTGAVCHEVDASSYRIPLWRAVLGVAPQTHQLSDPPDLLIAAGKTTHRLLLALRRMKSAKTVVLMTPGFPVRWVDAVIPPQHDSVKAAPNVFHTLGALNTITPLARITEKEAALILIGGPSRHVEWDEPLLLDQVTELMDRYPTWHWTISNSRRTPATTSTKLRELASAKVTVVDHSQTHSSWIAHQLAASRAAWVTPESVSMVFECVTSGVPTGLLDLSPSKRSRVSAGIQELIAKGYVCHWSDHSAVMSGSAVPRRELWEADRAARWLIKRLLPHFAR